MNRILLTCYFILISTGFLATGCTDQRSASARNEALPASHWFTLEVADQAIRVQLSVTPGEMAQGLMRRTELGEDDGMLFIHSPPQRASFWMKNTSLPLDIGYFDRDGVLREVYPLFPYDESSVRSRSDRIAFSLEMNQGWFSRNGIRPGAQLDLEQLGEALQARGFNPNEFELPGV